MPTGSTAHDYTPLNGTRDRFYFLYSALVDEGVIDPGGLYGPAQRDRQRLAWRRMKGCRARHGNGVRGRQGFRDGRDARTMRASGGEAT